MGWPVLLALAAAGLFAGIRLVRAGGDVEALAEIGTRFSEGDPTGTEGYDGQFSLYMARDLNPSRVALHLDRPAYRYQRILLPLLARVVVFGNRDLVGWGLLAIGLIAHGLGTLAVVSLLRHHDRSIGFAATYGLWVGLVVGVATFLHEPLAYALVAGGWAFRIEGRRALGAVLIGLALFAKETTLAFWLAALLADLLAGKSNRGSARMLAAGGAFFAVWQLWLWRTFGEPGLGSGGAQGTPFEWMPFAGLARVGQVDMKVLALYLVIFGPTIVLPAVWALVASVRALVEDARDPNAWGLGVNGALIAFLPFSTFREPLGLLRFASGLVLATLVFAAARNQRRVLAYSLFWCALLVVLVRG
ncbi:MAG TPA: hypothetical protein VFI11_14225 [Anaerolineales bacterium]|nr:hypothetical protein [Anaerolineales bacterium]